MIERRGFLKVATMMVGSLLVAKYIEPIIQIVTPEKHSWIEDKGDFYIVRVPKNKIFANEHLDKPTIFLMDDSSYVHDVNVEGYSNIMMTGKCKLLNCNFDTSKMVVQENRPAVIITSSGIQNMFDSNSIITNHSAVQRLYTETVIGTI